MSPQAVVAASSISLNDAMILDAFVSWLDNSNNASLKYDPIRYWNTSFVTNMDDLFSADYYSSSSFNEDLSQWDISRVTTMYQMSDSAVSLNGDVSSLNRYRVIDMDMMFYGAISFNGDVSAWNTSSVTDMSLMFECLFILFLQS